MPEALNRTTESELAEAVLSILALRKSGSGLFADLCRALPKVIPLTAEDMEESPSRPGEYLWQQRVRNITSHKGSEGNYITDGYLTDIKGGLKITDEGRARVAAARI
ncbi:hypothetical protein [Rhizobium leguminosarum]|uniref:hypothetical protein n=1 Tax=Rhizobium leguminosarum TaxID=384 RepID=UPI003F968A21